MRAIKFKGQCIDPKSDGKIACGSLLTSPDGTERIFEHDHDKVFNYFSVDPDTICQFTGFFDRTAMKFMRVTCCARTNIRTVALKTTSAITTMP